MWHGAKKCVRNSQNDVEVAVQQTGQVPREQHDLLPAPNHHEGVVVVVVCGNDRTRSTPNRQHDVRVERGISRCTKGEQRAFS